MPVAWGGAGDYIFLDLGPDAEKPGRMIVQRCESDAPDPVASSFRAWLEEQITPELAPNAGVFIASGIGGFTTI